MEQAVEVLATGLLLCLGALAALPILVLSLIGLCFWVKGGGSD